MIAAAIVCGVGFCRVGRRTDKVGGLVELSDDVDGGVVVASGLGGLVVATAAKAVEDVKKRRDEEQLTVEERERATRLLLTAASALDVTKVPPEEERVDILRAKMQNGDGGFYQAVVAVHPTRILYPEKGSDRGGVVELKGGVLKQELEEQVGQKPLSGKDGVLVNGFQKSFDNEEELEEEAMEQTEYETEEAVEDLDTDDYTFEEISVYEFEEVSLKVNKCEIVVENGPGVEELKSCVAVITEIPILKAESECNGVMSERNEKEPIKNCLESKLTLMSGNGKRGKRNRSRGSGPKRRQRNRNRR